MTTLLDHKALISSLSTAERRSLCSATDGPGLWRCAVHFGLILCLGLAIHARIPYWPLLLVPQGVLLVFLFTLLHETIHRTAFRTTWLNGAVAHICGLCVFLGPLHFRYFHMAHHRFTHDPAHDPELASPRSDTRLGFLIYLSGIPEWRWRIANLLKTTLLPNQDAFVPARGKSRIRREACLFLVAYGALLFLFWPVLLWVWLIPLLLGGPFLRAYLLAEHSFCPHVANMLANTRTTFTNRLVRWLAWNMPYHAEHHACPAVPFHKLPEFHRLARAHLQETSPGYIHFTTRFTARAEAGHAPEQSLSS